jgi:PAS domain-containing protein
MKHFSDFDKFRGSLALALEEDSYFVNTLLNSNDDASENELSKAEKIFKVGTVVLPLQGDAEGHFIHVAGRRDAKPFNAEDLHLMGAIAGFISVLTAQAQQFRRRGESSRVFQYLINQLPLAVVCFDAQGVLLLENKLASQLLGDSGTELMRGALADKTLYQEGMARMHLEVDGRLLYGEGRRLDVDEGLSVQAFVLHDMSSQRERNLLQLEHSVFRAESRQTSLSVAVLEDRSEAGRLYGMLNASADSLQVDTDDILVLDAYTCACVFNGKRLRTARNLLKHGLPPSLDRDSVKGVLVADWAGFDDEAPAQSLIDAAREEMRPLAALLRPALLVLDPYPAVLESLVWVGGEIASFEQIDDVQFTVDRIKSGEFDGLFLDIDTFGDHLGSLHAASNQAGGGFRIFYISHKQLSMVCSNYGLGSDAIVFQKPFDSEKLRQTLALHFNLT